MTTRGRTISTLAAGVIALTLGACAESGGASSLAGELREEMEIAGALFSEGVIELMESGEGKAALQTVVGEHSTLFYDGDTRFAQLSRGFTVSGPVWSLEMVPGGMDGGFARSVRLTGLESPDGVRVTFEPTAIVLTAPTASNPDASFTLDWAPGTLAPYGTIDLTTGDTEVSP